MNTSEGKQFALDELLNQAFGKANKTASNEER